MERLQKVLAKAGVASRRKSEELIKNGKVKVNGQVVTKLGTKVNPYKDKIEIMGKEIPKRENPVYLLLNKPKGYITTVKDTHGRKTVMDLIPKGFGRLFPVGRLDAQTKGLLILTNDGELTYKLTHPKHKIKKKYLVTINGIISKEALRALSNGIILEDGKTAPAEVKVIHQGKGISVVAITIHEGKNRQIRRMFDAVGYPVVELERISFAFLNLDGVPRGKYKKLTPKEVWKLKNL